MSAATPPRCTGLVFGIVLGVMVFDDQLDGLMLLGFALIVSAGLVAVNSTRTHNARW